VLGFVQTGPQLVADRYTYLACLPWAMLVAAAVARTWDAPLPATMRRLAAGAGIAAAATLAALTVRQIAVWHDTDALWERVLRLDPRCFIAYNNRGLLREGRGDEGGALADFNRALEIHPGYPLAWYNRGNARRAIGDVDGAIADLTIAIRLNPADPQAWNNRGWNREAKGDLRGAGADYEQALHVAPADFQGRALILQNLARVRSALGAS